MRTTTALFGAVAALALLAGPALATTNFGTFTIGATNSQSTTTYAGASTFANGQTTFAGYSGSVVTSVATISGGVLNADTNPGSGFDNTITNYLSAESVPVTISFNSNQKYFGLLWGSVDPGNTISFYEGSTLVDSFTGAQLNGAAGVALQYYPANGSFVDFAANGASNYFNKVVITDTDAPFESANYASIAAGVPEPAAWAMMILGLGAIGAVSRRRKTGLAAA